MTTTQRSTAPDTHEAPRGGDWRVRLGSPAIVAGTVAAALLVNMVIWAVGDLAGGTFEFTDGGRTSSAAPGGVVVLTVVPLTVGMVSAALVARRWPVLLRAGQVVGSLLAVATIGWTIEADFDTASSIALSLTHVTLVPAVIVGLELLRRRATAIRRGRP